MRREMPDGYVFSYRGPELARIAGPWLGFTGTAEYEAAIFRASYYRWCAVRGFVGRDPVDGREHKTPAHRAAERAGNLAQARAWLEHAADIRARYATMPVIGGFSPQYRTGR